MLFLYRGFSMYPFLKQGDLLQVRPGVGREIGFGDVIVFGDGVPIVHRVIEHTGNGSRGWVRTKGDNIKSRTESVPLEAVRGKVVAVRKPKQWLSMECSSHRVLNALMACLSRWEITPSLLRGAVGRFVRSLFQRGMFQSVWGCGEIHYAVFKRPGDPMCCDIKAIMKGREIGRISLALREGQWLLFGMKLSPTGDCKAIREGLLRLCRGFVTPGEKKEGAAE